MDGLDLEEVNTKVKTDITMRPPKDGEIWSGDLLHGHWILKES